MSDYNQAKADTFVQNQLQILNNAGIAIMISIGHQLKLFDVLAELPPSSSKEIATAANLNERYVREWLAAMVTGRVIEYDNGKKTYSLPQEYASTLTHKNYPNNLAVLMQFIPTLAQAEDKILERFKQGGGIGYAEYPKFHRVMAELSDQTVLAHLIETILPLNQDVVTKLKQGAYVADIGCGLGHAINLMAEHYPNSQFVGYDLCNDVVTEANQRAEKRQLKNVKYIEQDVANWKPQAEFDFITAFDAIHDQGQPAIVLENIVSALKDNGLFLMQDIKAHTNVHDNLENPVTPITYVISCLHCMPISLSQDGVGLGACWGKELAEDMLKDAGFSHVNVNELDHDILNYYYLARK